jgi:hypothetical protein
VVKWVKFKFLFRSATKLSAGQFPIWRLQRIILIIQNLISRILGLNSMLVNLVQLWIYFPPNICNFVSSVTWSRTNPLLHLRRSYHHQCEMGLHTTRPTLQVTFAVKSCSSKKSTRSWKLPYLNKETFSTNSSCITSNTKVGEKHGLLNDYSLFFILACVLIEAKLYI